MKRRERKGGRERKSMRKRERKKRGRKEREGRDNVGEMEGGMTDFLHNPEMLCKKSIKKNRLNF